MTWAEVVSLFKWKGETVAPALFGSGWRQTASPEGRVIGRGSP